MIDAIPYVIAAMTFWDFVIHIIDKRDRKYSDDKKWAAKLIRSRSIFSYFYPHFWGKMPQVSLDQGWRSYDLFWVLYWGVAFLLMVTYLMLR